MSLARSLQTIQADIDALQGNIATGARSVTFTDHSVIFNSIGDMQAALAGLIAELAIAQNGRRIRRVRFQTSKGLGFPW